MDFTEKTVGTKHIFKGVVVDLRVDDVILPDGEKATREIISHPGGVCVFAADDDGNVFMVRQFRNPTGQVLLEIPAGKLEYGENPDEAVRRELEEETGMVAEEYIPMGYIYPTPAYCEEKIYMYFTKNLRKTHQHLDDDEFLEVLKIPYNELYKMAISGEITDGKTALVVLKAKEYMENMQ